MSEPRLSADIFVDPEDYEQVTVGLFDGTGISVKFGPQATLFWYGDFESLITRLWIAYKQQLAAYDEAEPSTALPGEGGSYGGTE